MKQQQSFTLIELLVVMVIIIVLYVAMYSSWSRSWQTRQKALCQKNLQFIYVALKTYADDHDGVFPSLAGAVTSDEPLSMLVPQYTSQTDFFICPGSKDPSLPPAQSFAGRKISYAYYMGRSIHDEAKQPLLSDEQVDTRAKIESQVLFSPDGKPPGNNHYSFGGNILYCDGHIDTSPTHAAHELPVPPPVILLNPRP